VRGAAGQGRPSRLRRCASAQGPTPSRFARALGGTGCLSRLDAAHPRASLPSRASRSSGLRPRGHAAQSAATFLRLSLRASFAPRCASGSQEGGRASLGVRGFAPRCHSARVRGRSLREKCSARVRGRCAFSSPAAPPNPSPWARGGCGWTPCPRLRRFPRFAAPPFPFLSGSVFRLRQKKHRRDLAGALW
jgi:hypothetical protein